MPIDPLIFLPALIFTAICVGGCVALGWMLHDLLDVLEWGARR